MFVFGVDDGYEASLKAATIYFKDFLVESFDKSVIPPLDLIKRLLIEYNTEIGDK
jgi:hypothetical protein